MTKSKLIPCKHCGATIARTAKACPHCGGRNKKSVLKRFMHMILVLVLLFVGLLTYNHISTQSRNEQRRQAVQDRNATETISPVKEAYTQAESTDEPILELTIEPTAEPTTKVAKDKSGVSADFKEKMDSLETFFDEYAEFMVKYSKSGNAASMLIDYTSYMTKYADAMNALDSIDESKLSSAEDAYYAQVMARISAKLLEAAGSM